MPQGFEVVFLRDAVKRVWSNPSLWLMALCLVMGEAGCHAQARRYPDGVSSALRFDGTTIPADGETLDTLLVAYNGTVVIADGLAIITGQRDATGAEAVGAVLGTWLAALPATALLLLLGAWLLPGYYRLHAGDQPAARPFAPGGELFRRVLVVRAISVTAVAGAAALGALPGIVLLGIAGLTALPWLAGVGMAATLTGTIGGWLYVQAGVLFADREAVLGTPRPEPMVALRTSWSRARGRRLRRLTWAFGAWVIEVFGSLGWFLWFLGFFTHPLARAVSDTLLTRLYIQEASHA